MAVFFVIFIIIALVFIMFIIIALLYLMFMTVGVLFMIFMIVVLLFHGVHNCGCLCYESSALINTPESCTFLSIPSASSFPTPRFQSFKSNDTLCYKDKIQIFKCTEHVSDISSILCVCVCVGGGGGR